MGLNEVPEMRVVLEPLVMLLSRKSFIPETTRATLMELSNKDRGKCGKRKIQLPVFRVEVS